MAEDLSRVVTPEGKLRIPLYHGTSSIFILSILEEGLGAVNIHQAYSIPERAAKLLKASEAFKGKEPWPLTRYFCAKLANTPPPNDSHTSGFSYRYGGVYLTPSRQTAIRYATRSLGSEALGILYDMLVLFADEDLALLDDTDQSLLAQMKAVQTYPVLIKIDGIAVDDLRAEQGGDARAALEDLNKYLADDADLFDDLTQQTNFELIRPIPPNDFSAYKIECSPAEYPHFRNAKIFKLNLETSDADEPERQRRDDILA
jgi:hypothetical protein